MKFRRGSIGIQRHEGNSALRCNLPRAYTISSVKPSCCKSLLSNIQQICWVVQTRRKKCLTPEAFVRDGMSLLVNRIPCVLSTCGAVKLDLLSALSVQSYPIIFNPGPSPAEDPYKLSMPCLGSAVAGSGARCLAKLRSPPDASALAAQILLFPLV